MVTISRQERPHEQTVIGTQISQSPVGLAPSPIYGLR
jgi:hypothetical protein